MLDNLSIHNYKSIRNLNLRSLPAFSVLVGANASGKSNFADALDFLSLVFRGGLASAVRAKGGYENICFRRAKRSKGDLEFGFKTSIPESERLPRRKRVELSYTFSYSFAFRAMAQRIAADYEVTKEEITVEIQGPEPADRGRIHLWRSKGMERAVEAQFSGAISEMMPSAEFYQDYPRRARVPEYELFVPTWWTHLPPFHLLRRLFESCRVYQISPHEARQTGVPERSPELGRHGENLPAAVDYLKRSDADAFNELLAHLKHTVPSIERLETHYVETKQLGLFFKEMGVGRPWFSQDVSDGTIQTVSIFLPLVDPRTRILVIDEPENSLHPWILRHFIESCKLQSENKQIFIATQSLVAVNEVPPESLYIVRRTEGETTIERCVERYPEAKEVISQQLLGLGDYWDTGGLGAIPEYGEQLRLLED